MTGQGPTAVSQPLKAEPLRHLVEAPRAAHPEFERGLGAPIKVDPAMRDDPLEWRNINLPRRVLRRLHASARVAGETRSGLIARLAIEGREPITGA